MSTDAKELSRGPGARRLNLERRSCPPFVNKALRVIVRSWLAARFRLIQHRRHRRLVIEHVEGIPLVILPNVFNPALFFSSAALVRVMFDKIPAGRMKVLDMGTGCGALGIAAAKLGAQVVAVDVLEDAVRCARMNVILNKVEHLVEVREGDLFEPVANQTFDLVLFNPPYYSGTPSEDWERAWRSSDVIDRFARRLPDVLAKGGRALLVVSSETVGIREAEHTYRIESQVLWERNLISERFMVLEWRPRSAGGDQ